MSQPDNTVPTTTSSVPDQLPDPGQQSPSLFAQYMANAANSNPQPTQTQPPPVSQNPITGGPQVNPGNGQPPKPLYADSSEKTSTDPRDLHPSVQSASIVRRVAETLAGGPRVVTTIDPETGERKQTPVPLSSRQILLGAVANILGGTGQIASNLSNRMEGRAPKPIAPLPTQVAQQQQAAQADSDYDRIQNQKVRQAKVLTANMEAARVAYGLAHEEEETKRAEVAAHADSLANWEKAGAVSASGLSGDDMMKSDRFPKADYFFVPDGVVPLYRNGERVMTNNVPASTFTYSAIKGSEQAKVTQEAYDQFVKYGLMKPSKPLSDQGDTFRLPEGSTISGPTLALMNYKVALVNQLQRELDTVHDAVGGTKVDLASEIRNNPRLLSSVEQWHNADAGIVDDPVRQLQVLKAAKNPKAQSAADNIAALFTPDSLSKYVALKAPALAKMDDATARSVLANPQGNPNSAEYKQAQGVLQGPPVDADTLKSDIANINALGIPAELKKAEIAQLRGVSGQRTYAAAMEAINKRNESVLAKPPAPEKPEKPQDMVIGTVNGRQVAGTPDELKAAGAKNYTKAGAAEAEKVNNARSLTNVFDSGDPDDLGLVQLASKLDKEGKLGPATTRFQDWLNHGNTAANFDAGDPDVQRLFTKMGLATTGLMQVHVGARGSAQMLEHFEDLAKAKQMSPTAFRTALDVENRYVKMKAMLPSSGTSQASSPQTVQTPAPQTHSFSLSAWQKANPNGDVNTAKAAALQQGYQVIQ